MNIGYVKSELQLRTKFVVGVHWQKVDKKPFYSHIYAWEVYQKNHHWCLLMGKFAAFRVVDEMSNPQHFLVDDDDDISKIKIERSLHLLVF